MKITLKEGARVVYQRTTNEITVEIGGVDYTIRNSEDDNGCDYYVYSETLNDGNFMNPYDIEDEELQEVIVRLAEGAYDDYTFGSQIKVGDEINIDELDY